MSAQYTPGPWRTSYWGYGGGQRNGWYVSRTNNGKTEWLKARTKARCFPTARDAVAAIARATGSAS